MKRSQFICGISQRMRSPGYRFRRFLICSIALLILPYTLAHADDTSSNSVGLSEICDILSMSRSEQRKRLYNLLIRDIPGGDATPLLFTASDETQELFRSILETDERADLAFREGGAFRTSIKESAERIYSHGSENYELTLTPHTHVIKRLMSRLRQSEAHLAPRTWEHAQAIATATVRESTGIDPTRPFSFEGGDEALQTPEGQLRLRRAWRGHATASAHFRNVFQAELNHLEPSSKAADNDRVEALLNEEITRAIERAYELVHRSALEAVHILEELNGRQIDIQVRVSRQSQDTEAETLTIQFEHFDLNELEDLRLAPRDTLPSLDDIARLVPITRSPLTRGIRSLRALARPLSRAFWTSPRLEAPFPFETKRVLGSPRSALDTSPLVNSTIARVQMDSLDPIGVAFQVDLEGETYTLQLDSIREMIRIAIKAYDSRTDDLHTIRRLQVVDQWMTVQTQVIGVMLRLRDITKRSRPDESLQLLRALAGRESVPTLDASLSVGPRYLVETYQDIPRPLQEIEWYRYLYSNVAWQHRAAYFRERIGPTPESHIQALRRHWVSTSRTQNYLTKLSKVIGLVSIVALPYTFLEVRNHAPPDALSAYDERTEAENSGSNPRSEPVIQVRSEHADVPSYFYTPSRQEMRAHTNWLPRAGVNSPSSATNRELTLDTIVPFSVSEEGDLVLARPASHRLVSLEIERVRDALNLTPGLDYTVYEHRHFGLLKARFRPGRFERHERYRIRARYAREESHVQSHTSPTESAIETVIPREKVDSLIEIYRERGLARIAKELTALADRRGPITLRELAQVHAHTTRYSHKRRIRLRWDSLFSDAPFARITRFLRDDEGTLYMECDGSKEFFQQTLEYLNLDIEYSTADMYVYTPERSDGRVGTLGSLGHVQTRVWLPGAASQSILIDTTSPNLEPPPAEDSAPLTLEEALPRWYLKREENLLPDVQELGAHPEGEPAPRFVPEAFKQRPHISQHTLHLLRERRTELIQSKEFRTLIRKRDLRNAPGRLVATVRLLEGVTNESLTPTQFWIALAEVYPTLYSDDFDFSQTISLSDLASRIFDSEFDLVERMSSSRIYSHTDFDPVRLQNLTRNLLDTLKRSFD